MYEGAYAHDDWNLGWLCLRDQKFNGHSFEELNDFVISIQAVAQNTYHDDMEIIIRPAMATVSIHHKFEDEFPAVEFHNSNELWVTLVEMAKRVKEDCLISAKAEYGDLKKESEETEEEYKDRLEILNSFSKLIKNELDKYIEI